jgi:hypothetical protein
VPPQVERVSDEDDLMETKAVFRQCLGHVFRVRGIGTNNRFGETDHIELWVRGGFDCDDEVNAESIWVEQEYVEIVDGDTR